VATRAANRRRWRAGGQWVHHLIDPRTQRCAAEVTLALTALHASALLGDRFVRFDALDVLLPFVCRYRSLSVGLGLLAAYLAIVIHQSFAWRRRLGAKLWRSLHYASFAGYAAALLHGVFAGTDAGGLAGVYLASGALVGSLLLYRVAIPRRHRGSSHG
jgi:methionine sulfoxide reductase heme-binding subunit